jgi:hypothetical protein
MQFNTKILELLDSGKVPGCGLRARPIELLDCPAGSRPSPAAREHHSLTLAVVDDQAIGFAVVSKAIKDALQVARFVSTQCYVVCIT